MKRMILKSLGIFFILMLFIVPLVRIVSSLLSPTFYYSHAIVHVVFPESSTEKYDTESLNAMTRTISMLAYSDTVLSETAKALHLSAEWGEIYQAPSGFLDNTTLHRILRHSISISPVEDTVGLVYIGVRTSDPNESALLANEIAARLDKYVSRYPQQIVEADVRLVNEAEPPLRSMSPPLVIAGIKSVGVGLGLGVIGFMFLYFAGKTLGGEVRTKRDEIVESLQTLKMIEGAGLLAEATFHCNVCGKRAGRIQVFEKGSWKLYRSTCFLGDATFRMSDETSGHVLLAIDERSLKQLRSNRSDFTPFYCPECDAAYCIKHWHTWDAIANGTSQGVHGMCPEEHDICLKEAD